MKFAIPYVFLLAGLGLLGSCSSGSTGTKQTVMSQTGNNKAFPANKEHKMKSRKYRANKSSVKDKQRQHARFQGHENSSQ